MPKSQFLLSTMVLCLAFSACSGNHTAASVPAPLDPMANPLPGMPPILDPHDIYAADRPGALSPVVREFRPLVYVPDSGANRVDVIDPRTFRIIHSFPVGKQPQHVTPSYDMRTLWVLCDLNDQLIQVDPLTGKPGRKIFVKDPYNMYYTPDGKYAVVCAERIRRLNFLDPQTMKLKDSLEIPYRGVDHLDFSANGRYFLASCEFDSQVIKVDTESRKMVGHVALKAGGMPQDVKLSPDGRVFYVADMMADGVYEIDGESMKIIGFLPTGKGAHGLYVSRDSKYLYASNRGEGSVSVIDLATRKEVTKWRIPEGGSPDMGGVSADGKVLWLSGRYSKEVYAFDTTDGHLLARIPVGKGPHGLCVYPQPGRYSLGHTGIFR
ncbi:MAG TPA: YncE family protein [Bryobacteraceae bacterium]|nr:YncE family protein [Bryobacteraceae bacterium]